MTSNVSYLCNVKKILKLARKTSKDTKLCFSFITCRTNIKDINGKNNETDSYLRNYCKQQNLGFINNSNINKSDLIVKGEEE